MLSSFPSDRLWTADEPDRYQSEWHDERLIECTCIDSLQANGIHIFAVSELFELWASMRKRFQMETECWEYELRSYEGDSFRFLFNWSKIYIHTSYMYILLMFWGHEYLFKDFLTVEIKNYCSDTLPTPTGAIPVTDYNKTINWTITFKCADHFQPANGIPPKTSCSPSTPEKGIWSNMSGACIRIFSLLSTLLSFLFVIFVYLL